MKVTVYTADWCGPCRMLKAAFKKAGIKVKKEGVKQDLEYEPIDIDACAKEAKEAGVRGVPTIVITDYEGKDTRIVGFDNKVLQRVKQELGIGE